MSSETTNFGLIKPDEDEFYDIQVQNENMDKIDQQLKENADNIASANEAFNEHLVERNPHGTTASDVGAVNKKGDTMTGTLTLPSLVLQNGSKIMENAEQRLVISAHKNRLDVITEDNQKHMFRHMNGDLYVYDENGYLIDSFKSLKNKISNIKRQETTLFSGSLTSGTATLNLTSGSLNDFDEIIVKGKMYTTSSTPITFDELIEVDESAVYERSKTHTVLFTADSTVAILWIQFRLHVNNKTLFITYNRKQPKGSQIISDTTENIITSVIGVKYKTT